MKGFPRLYQQGAACREAIADRCNVSDGQDQHLRRGSTLGRGVDLGR
jgi:hypothetical protein